MYYEPRTANKQRVIVQKLESKFCNYADVENNFVEPWNVGEDKASERERATENQSVRRRIKARDKLTFLTQRIELSYSRSNETFTNLLVAFLLL